MKKLKKKCRESIQSALSFSLEEQLFSQQTPLLRLLGFFRLLGSLPAHKIAEQQSFFSTFLIPAHSDGFSHVPSKDTIAGVWLTLFG